jgi:hypothetical protein
VNNAKNIIQMTLAHPEAAAARVNCAAAAAFLHLRGVRNAPRGRSAGVPKRKVSPWAELKSLTDAAGASPKEFPTELRTALRVQDAVVIGGERDVDNYIAARARRVRRLLIEESHGASGGAAAGISTPERGGLGRAVQRRARTSSEPVDERSRSFAERPLHAPTRNATRIEELAMRPRPVTVTCATSP